MVIIDDIQNLDEPTTLNPIIKCLEYYSKTYNDKIILFTLNENLKVKGAKETLEKIQIIKQNT